MRWVLHPIFVKYFVFLLLVSLGTAQQMGIKHAVLHAHWTHEANIHPIVSGIGKDQAFAEREADEQDPYGPYHACQGYEQATLSYPLAFAHTVFLAPWESFKEKNGFSYQIPDLVFSFAFFSRAPPRLSFYF